MCEAGDFVGLLEREFSSTVMIWRKPGTISLRAVFNAASATHAPTSDLICFYARPGLVQDIFERDTHGLSAAPDRLNQIREDNS
jgi:hypothetical protein